MFVDDDTTVFGVEADGLGEVRIGSHTRGGDHDVAVQRGTGV